MRVVDADPDDDPGFVELVACLVAGVLAVHGPQDARVFKIDNWFDHKWLGFAGKAVGAVGVWRNDAVVPPFVANRIVHQRLYRRDEDGGYRLAGPGPEIHHRGPSMANLLRPVWKVAPASALFWYSGNTLTTGRGSLIGYLPVEGEDPWTWFLALARDGSWKVTRRKNIHDYEVRSFENAADPARRDRSGV